MSTKFGQLFTASLCGTSSYRMSVRLYSAVPAKPVITIPVQVESRALKRHRSIKQFSKDQDRERLKKKPVLISCKRPELNHHLGQTYGTFDNVPLASRGWTNRKSYDDYFVINKLLPNRANTFTADREDAPAFHQLNLDGRLVESLNNCGYHKLTNIQNEALPSMINEQEFHTLIAAETGNGKTLCFLLPIIQNILRHSGERGRGNNFPLALVVAPSKELAAQIGAVARRLCDSLGIKVEVALGGQRTFKGQSDLLVGSFGCLMKSFSTGAYSRKYVSTIALDEIDTLLDDTFKPALVEFLQKFGQSTQTLLTGIQIIMTGATFPTNFELYIGEALDVENIQRFSTDQIHKILFHIPQKFIRVAPSRKLETLRQLLERDLVKNKKTIIFSNKGSTADFLDMFLQENNIKCLNFNQNVYWKERDRHFREFAFGNQVNILSATDLASRGLDTSMVNHVINYDFPLNPADYIHRVGRAGRVGGVGNSHVTSLVDNALGIEVLQRIELAARKNTEINNVNNNIIRIIRHRQKKKDQSNSQ